LASGDVNGVKTDVGCIVPNRPPNIKLRIA
jgi:hypothetical protein